MDAEGGISAAIVGALLICLRMLERTHDKKNGNGSNTNTRIALLESQLQELSGKVEQWGSKTVETLRLVYELRESHKIAEARREAVDEARREMGT